MIGVLLLPILVSAALGLFARPLGRGLPPAVAARLLPAAALGLALATGLALSVVAVLIVARLTRELPLVGVEVSAPASALLPWRQTLPTVLGPAAALLTVVLAAAAVRRCLRLWRDLSAAQVELHDLGAADRGPFVVNDPFPAALAVAGRHGRVVVSTGLLGALEPCERVAVLAHERSHVAHRHHAWIFLAQLAAAADPLLAPVVAACRQACERWADEDAAAAVRDRRVVAAALATAALLRASAVRAAVRIPAGPFAAATSRLAAGATCPAGGGDVVRRAEALLRPPPVRRPLVVAAVALAVALTAGLVTADAAGAEGLLDAAVAAPGHCSSVRGAPSSPVAAIGDRCPR